MTRKCILALLLIVSACSTMAPPYQTAETLHAHCFSVPFESYVDCLESGFDRYLQGWRTTEAAPVWLLYFAWSRSASELVKSGKITELDARTAMTNFHAEVAEINSVIYSAPETARMRMRLLSPPDFRRTGGAIGGGALISCTSVSLGGGISDIQCR